MPVEVVDHPGLLVLPGRLTLAPGQEYKMVLKEPDVSMQPQVWRVTFHQRGVWDRDLSASWYQVAMAP
ncbi:hypothetical protein KPA96_13255 [Burkholderia cenocepacia]|uniref:hypothetical protein n=1 Tax=Burkholderia cenocepacia TaxID=95486 RepID=UPI00285A69B3|nr:hypothetical protein [Burkholderia cenocepacia]MDR8076627.1 hypothetical protein [Burkholderia cenocepacia]